MAAEGQKEGELVINASGALASKDGNWGPEVDQVVSTVWQLLKDAKHLFPPTESMVQITVRFGSRTYVITGKAGLATWGLARALCLVLGAPELVEDSTYYVTKWTNS
ncbi:unnamed protein product [Symbiodinium sp. CCMP2456]|nr:unnamed protein product [Symbiodinium sp. CCMP2456]